MGGVWVFPGGAVDAHEGEGDDVAPARRRARARGGGRRSTASTRPRSSSSRAGSRRARSRSASTRTSSSRRCPTAQEPAVDGERVRRPRLVHAAGRARRARARRARCSSSRRSSTSSSSRRSRPPTSCSRYARGREVAAGRAARRDGGRGRARRCCPASPGTTTSARSSTRRDALTVAPRMTATLPAEIREVFDRFITTEYVTIDAAGQPIAWPVTPYHHPDERLHRRHDRARLPEEGRRRRSATRTSRCCSPTRPAAASTARRWCSCRAPRDVDDARPRGQPRALRARGPGQAARRRRSCRRSSSASAAGLVLRRASTSTSGPSASTSGRDGDAERASRSCSTRTSRRSAPATTRSPRPARRRPRAARPSGTSGSTRSAAATYPTAVLAVVGPDGFPFAVRVPGRAPTAARGCPAHRAPSRSARRSSRAWPASSSHDHDAGVQLAAQLPGPRRPRRATTTAGRSCRTSSSAASSCRPARCCRRCG